MASTDSTLIPGYGKPSPTTPNQGYTFGDALGGALTSTAAMLGDVYKDYANQQMQTAAYANSVSAAAQMKQFQMNQELMQKQYDMNYKSMIEQMKYNSESAKVANELQKELFYKAMEYNSQEANTNRTWETQMSNTAYQRAVADMRAAGINPILAAQNGGATVGSGATASINSGNASMRQGVSGGTVSGTNVGSYSGQSYHLNDSFAMIGSALGALGNVLSAAKSSGVFGSIGSNIYNGIDQVAKALGGGLDKLSDRIDDLLGKNNNWNNYSVRGPFGGNDYGWGGNSTGKGHYSGGGGGHGF